MKHTQLNEFGLEIINFEASSILAKKYGIREKYKTSRGLFPNSLLCEFLLESGIETNDDGTKTRDIICINFERGLKKPKDESLKTLDESFKQLTKHEIRRDFYKDGVTVHVGGKDIHYRMLYRTAGKAKSGSCIFINSKFYEAAKNYLHMGKKFQDEEAHIVEIGAYQSLVASAIVGKVEINPKNILIIPDVDVPFERETVSVLELLTHKKQNDENYKANLKNTLFDGQALIDTEVFNRAEFFDKEENPNGYILLRHHFCKSAAFCTDIKQFFKDYCAEHKKDYETFTVKDIYGKEKLVKDIELITTENSMKWMKFSKTKNGYDYKAYREWCRKVSENKNMFGIVKTAHKSRLKDYARMSYQMVNVLENDESKLKKIAECSAEYLSKIRKAEYENDFTVNVDDNDFIKHLDLSGTETNEREVLAAICRKNRLFLQSDYFRDRKNHICDEFKKDLNCGRIIQNAENLVIAGSPYAMLMAAAGEDIKNNHALDTMFKTTEDDKDSIKCFTTRFKDGEYLAEFRSPFNSRNNMGYLHNVYPTDEKVKNYFRNFGSEIIAVDLIGNDFQCRNNGSDQDSDFLYCTNQTEIVECAKKFYTDYPTIVNDIPLKEESKNPEAEPLSESLLLEKYADKDEEMSESQMKIGLISNNAQLCLTYSYNTKNPKEKKKFDDYVCVLSVLAQCEIDKAKRIFDIPMNTGKKKTLADELLSEIRQIRKMKHTPDFWSEVVENKNGKTKKYKKQKTDEKSGKTENSKVNQSLKSPMSFIYKYDFKTESLSEKKNGKLKPDIPLKDFFIKNHGAATKKVREIEEIISLCSKEIYEAKVSDDDENYEDKLKLLSLDFHRALSGLIKKKERKGFTQNDWDETVNILIDRAFLITYGKDDKPKKGKAKENRKEELINTMTKRNRGFLLKALYTVDKESVLKCFKSEEEMAEYF